ncbi:MULTISPECIES: type II toxin-antitoxin system VapC family toxin [Thiorhodovibrio]|uniref:type II toxin-antitoxin system VapC family toxin n=1 Tax=Thiorhodovibrio TaxID=61593 RepID=UPI001912657B|nr:MULTISPECIES: type II toxin-antitoxin system VapC family toxin [Thiorhodovibrio]MBK5969886.1 VapC toxin family PIN domain ribonuclease [Thiorhodovibrio winogradskyi]WPL12069.1 putative ribonuclease VapC19 [Thiorhodovibrio litoralis]
MLIDTDVLIWNLRGNATAADLLDHAGGFILSAITYMELIQGVRDKAELSLLRRSLNYWNANIQPLDQEISGRAIFLMEAYALSHGLQMADALIGATAVSLGATLVTAKDKHYRMIDGLEIEVFRP